MSKATHHRLPSHQPPPNMSHHATGHQPLMLHGYRPPAIHNITGYRATGHQPPMKCKATGPPATSHPRNPRLPSHRPPCHRWPGGMWPGGPTCHRWLNNFG
ncbi:unnamed protein product [Orchesella dallaii]|uniref:Uncharacterized protein n=1 Tax=Orchesella dallaii TaxID=48710 RepID=A0ABP1S424_9HEXA